MPQININISKKLSDETKNALQIEIANSIDMLPGKTKEVLTVCIIDSCSIYKNSQMIDGAFIDIRVFQNTTKQGKNDFTNCLFDIVNRILNIPHNQMNINFIELQDWGSSGVYKTAPI